MHRSGTMLREGLCAQAAKHGLSVTASGPVQIGAPRARGGRGCFVTPLRIFLPPFIRSRVFLSPLQGLARPPSGIAMQRFR
jgi:hypothetical protein